MKIYTIFIFCVSSIIAVAQKDSSIVKLKPLNQNSNSLAKREKQEKKDNFFMPFVITTIVPEKTVSKSERTATPTIIKIKREELSGVINLQDLIKTIPTTCNVISSLITFSTKDGTSEMFVAGNNIAIITNLLKRDGKFIVIENICSSCPTLHKANYKIIFQ